MIGLLFLAQHGTISQAALYTYTDDKGVLIITETPPKGQKARLLETTAKRPKGFKGPARTGREFLPLVGPQAKGLGLSPALLQAIIKTESNFNPKAESPRGAIGLMQLMPATWKAFGVVDPFDPKQNIRAGSAYFEQLKARYKDLDLALAAYNAGPGNVEKYKGIPPFDETRRYIRKVRWYYDYYRNKGNLVELPGVTEAFDQGTAALGRGELRRADEHFQRVVRRFPNSPEANYNLALVYEKMGLAPQALRYYKKAIRIDPYFKEAYYNLAILYERVDQIEQAIATWNQYVRYEVKEDQRRDVLRFVRELRQISNR